jgi:5-methylcytosine-specific restriction protein A
MFLLLNINMSRLKVLSKHLRDVYQGKAPAGALRSTKWPKVRKAHLEKHPTCAVCNSTIQLEVHHIVPFARDPEKELDPDNLITLCENSNDGVISHLLFGHLGNYQYLNPDVVKDAKIWNEKFNKRERSKNK